MLLPDIQNTALSGLEAYVVSERQCSRLDSAINRVARVCMRGAATEMDENGVVTGGTSTMEVLRYWRMGTASVELAIRRLKWLQQMALHPCDHRLVFNTIFGDSRGERLLELDPCTVDLEI